MRIAVVGKVDERLVGDLRLLPLRPEVRPFGSLVGDTEALSRFQPDLVWIAFESASDEDIGAVRLLQRLWPQLGIVVAATPAQELAMAPVQRRLGALLSVYPGAPGQLAATLEQALHGSDRPRPELFTDLAHGLADEINNPLMFVSGHLQLLRATLDPNEEHDRRAQVDAALAGLSRIQASVDRLRLLSQAAAGPRRREPVDLAALVTDAVASRKPDAPAATVALADGKQVVTGDREQLELATRAIVQFADVLAALGAHSHLELDSLDGARRLRLTARGPTLAHWQLPNTFEPFYPQRALRGQGHGLGPFLAQTVVLGHNGQATVRRQRDGALAFDFALPVQPGAQPTAP